MKRAVISGIGHAVPPRILSNADLERMVATSDEWITQRTGIRERHVLSEGENCIDLCVAASKKAIETAGVTPESIDLVIVATVSADRVFPSTACVLQHALGLPNAGAYDLGAACAGFIFSVGTATAMIESGQCNTILVVGVDVLSRFIDYTDRSTCVLFGDGAGAVVIQAKEDTDRGVIGTIYRSDGGGADFIAVEAGGSRHPMTEEGSCKYNPYIAMAGSETYRFAVNAMGDACHAVIAKTGISVDEIDLFVPHQANLRIIRSAQQRLGLPDERVFVNVEKYGNTSAGSIPLALSEAVEQGRLKPGMIVLTVGFGAGLTWGANLIKW